MTVYYNEINAYAAQWLRNLIAAGHIEPGVVDERSIEDVRPRNLDGFTQCHFFAGIGVWSLALRRAGWPDDRPVWTGSCPCQPFSEAGQGAGFDDERHLWPHFHWLIQERRPAIVFGEQVAKKRVDPWIDLVCADVEALGYAFGAVPFPAAGVGAPHIRERAYWVADAGGERLEKRRGHGREQVGTGRWRHAHAESRSTRKLGNAGQHDDASQGATASFGESEAYGPTDQLGRPSLPFGGMADGGRQRRSGRQGVSARGLDDRADAGRLEGHDGSICFGEARAFTRPAGPTNGLWRDADWLLCRDGKWRPVEPGAFPLVDAWPYGSRVECLRAAGNAITLGQAQTFIEAVMDSMAQKGHHEHR